MKKVFWMLLVVWSMMHSKGEVLYWMVGDSAYVDGIRINTFLSAQTVDDDNWNAARVRVEGGGKTRYLDIYFGDGWWESGDYGVELYDNGSGHWGAGVPTGNQSLLEDDMLAEYVFAVELGHNAYDEHTGDVVWRTLAESEGLTRAMLQRYIFVEFDISPPTTMIWSPTEFHSVPEPLGACYVMLGMCLLMLRRRTVA